MLKLMKWGSFMIEKFNSKKFFIDLLTSYINGSKIELKDTDSVNWKEVYYLANIHNMVGQLYVVLRNSGIHCDAEIMQNCFNKFTYLFHIYLHFIRLLILNIKTMTVTFHSLGKNIKSCFEFGICFLINL